MTEQHTNLLPFYQGWDAYQGLLIKALAPLSDQQLALRAAPHLRSIGENAAHIVATRVSWFHMLMGEGSADIAPIDTWDHPGAPARNASELISGLEATWHMIQDALTRWTSSNLNDVFEGTHNDEEYQLTRQWIIWHVIEHDIHHGGEISFVLGMHNLEGIDI